MSAVSYKKDLHAILGVDEKAGPDELRKAYLSLAVKYHPDRNPGDTAAEERFKDISQAYAILSDPAARARYERLRPKKSTASSGASGSRSGASASSGPGASSRPGPGPAGAKGRPSSAGPSGRAAGAGAGAKPGSGSTGASASSSSAGKTGAASGAAGASGASSARTGAASGGSASKDSASAEAEAKARASSASQSETRGEAADGDFDEILSNFFKSDKGRETLRDLEGELGKAGVKFKPEDFAEWVRQRRKPAKQPTDEAPKSFLEKLTSWLPGAEARARKKAERYDISYQITITPQVAAMGTTVEISYQRDEASNRLSIKIPAGIKDGAKLRLGEQGRLKPDKSRGDLILTVQVSQPQTVADLWK
ncbi:hypothetical protein C4J81_07810 [Deltaproteobacteria bacterium Smac51]|nr:hypothetical protein C4J81_07810 [Deltaproteobacteria bacterium Smac51]